MRRIVFFEWEANRSARRVNLRDRETEGKEISSRCELSSLPGV